MKKLLLFLPAFILFYSAEAQILKKLADKAKQKIDQRIDSKVDRGMEGGLDKVEGKTKIKTGDGEIKEKTEADGDTKTKIKSNNQSLQAYSKYDFVQGEKVVAFEDFARTDVGDFPTNWNTNASAEVVTLNNKEGKWLKVNKDGVWLPEFIKSIPENATLEFDLGVSSDFDGGPFVLNIANPKNRDKDYTDFYHNVSWRHGHALHLQFKPFNGRAAGWARIQTATDGNYLVDNTSEFKHWDNGKNNFAHISLWRQNQRLRIYMNGEKLFDIPKAFEANGKYNMIDFAMQGSYTPDKDQYFFSNIRLAVGAPDTRNKLLTQGRFVTTGILFDVNSDKLKPESYGVLKEIAGVLNENTDVKVKIVGHTDSDGDDAKNLDLSKRRAASVKIALASDFKVDASRMETDGMGETKPVADNKSAEAKAQNRRVEFIKM